MKGSGKQLIQKATAIIVIAAILDVVGVPLILLGFLFIGANLVWRIAQRSDRREDRKVFAFYVSTHEILRDEERHCYGFEVEEVIARGRKVFESMPDPPPLVGFALGALHHRLGDDEVAVELLTEVVENGLREEYISSPSSQLRRYVTILRQLEREPATMPLALAAIRALERMRASHAAALLGESRQRLQSRGSIATCLNNDSPDLHPRAHAAPVGTPDSQMSPRSISEVLHDVYPDDNTR
jgi:hypothetical protein